MTKRFNDGRAGGSSLPGLAALSELALLPRGRAAAAGAYTANTQAEEIASMQARLDAQETELAQLRRATELPAPDEVPSGLALLCKGAGVPLEDVRWRVQSGLEPEQAVQAAAQQMAANQAAQPAKKGGK